LFTARIPLAGSADFKGFLRKRGQTLNQLDHIIAMRVLWAASLAELCTAMQRRADFGKQILDEMIQRLMVESDGEIYRLAESVRHDIETIFQSDQLLLDPTMWGDAG
jgi:hypothetical protein